eukprot:gnl/Spiro4/23045_TR11388_c0_g1_i1.p1 gnl/Spiro4/23045_TR11388_c0_g1~~gnl/Spiro4/23045_TR11388_c0_g1_i1.p1  ORF type:complete len:323 (-),score=110.89 gnl/Spiro4/23045_TR11388_c0_g1_i1:217-1185(-)
MSKRAIADAEYAAVPQPGTVSLAQAAATELALINQQRESCKQYVVTGFFLLIALIVLEAWFLGFQMHQPIIGVLVTLAILPGFLIMYFIYWKDSSDVLDLELAIRAFAYGVVCVIPCAITELLISGFIVAPLAATKQIEMVVFVVFLQAFLVAAFCEEAMKYFIACCVEDRAEVHHPYGMVVYAVSGALGAATLENLGYIMSNSGATALITAIVRGVLAVPLHGTTGGLIGVGIVRRAFLATELSFFEVIRMPVLIHGSYDFLLMLVAALSSMPNKQSEDDISMWAVAAMVSVCAIVCAGFIHTRNEVDAVCGQATGKRLLY